MSKKAGYLPSRDENQSDSQFQHVEEAESDPTKSNSPCEKEDNQASGFCLFGAKSVATLINKLSDQSDGVRGFGARASRGNDDIEYVHRMRVCARRLLVALPLFQECLCNNKSEFRRWMRAVRRLARSLGEARDADVQVDSIIRELEETPPKDAAGLKRLLLRLRQKRSMLQKSVVRALDRFDESSTEEEIMSRVRLLVGQAFIEGLDANDRGIGPGEGKAFAAVKERIAQVMSFGMPLPGSGDAGPLHEMRKSMKRLRYTLEIFAPAYGDRLKNHIGGIKSLQDVLGALHDCDVWLVCLPIFMKEERERTLAYQGHARGLARVLRGLQDFADVRRQTRGGIYATFKELWEKFCNARWWDEILKEMGE